MYNPDSTTLTIEVVMPTTTPRTELLELRDNIVYRLEQEFPLKLTLTDSGTRVVMRPES